MTTGAPDIHHYNVDGLDRRALIDLPQKKSALTPVIFAFHGHGGNIANAKLSFNLQNEWPEAMMVYMEGIPTKSTYDPKGVKNGWQIQARFGDNRDIHFFDEVWKDVQKMVKVDKKRVFVMGHSNGGRFTYLLWEQRSSIFAAAAPSGSPSLGLKLDAKPFFHIFGQKDPLVPPTNQRKSIELNKKLNQCDSTGKSKAKYLTTFGSKIKCPVWVYEHPGGHEYPREAKPFIAEFFKANPKR